MHYLNPSRYATRRKEKKENLAYAIVLICVMLVMAFL